MVEPTTLLGFNAHIYYNSGSYGTPTWVDCPSVRDLALNIEANDADVSTRGNGGWEAIVQGLKKGSIEFDMVWSKTSGALPADVQKFLDSFNNNAHIEVNIRDQPIATVGSQGLRCLISVQKFARAENLGESLRANVVIKPTLAEHAPAWDVTAS